MTYTRIPEIVVIEWKVPQRGVPYKKMVQHILARFLKRGHHQKRFWRRVLVVPQLEDGTSCASQLRNTRAFNHDKCTSINYNNSTVRKHICCIPILKEGKPCFFPFFQDLPNQPPGSQQNNQGTQFGGILCVRHFLFELQGKKEGLAAKNPREGSRGSDRQLVHWSNLVIYGYLTFGQGFQWMAFPTFV